MYYHLRYTPYELSSENLPDFFKRFDRYVIAREQFKKDGKTPTNTHFHCWFDTCMSVNGIRDAFRKAMSIPSGSNGKINKYYMLKKWNESFEYIIKQGNVISHQGIDEKQLEIKPEIHLEEGGTLKEKTSETAGAPPPAQKKEEKSFWKVILEEAMVIHFKEKRQIDIEEAVKLISRIYIKRMLPLPHPGDRKRWATSLVMYSKMGFDPEQSKFTEVVIEQEANQFIGEHLVIRQE